MISWSTHVFRYFSLLFFDLREPLHTFKCNFISSHIWQVLTFAACQIACFQGSTYAYYICVLYYQQIPHSKNLLIFQNIRGNFATLRMPIRTPAKNSRTTFMKMGSNFRVMSKCVWLTWFLIAKGFNDLANHLWSFFSSDEHRSWLGSGVI